MKQTIQRGVRGSAPFACSQLVAALALAMPMLSVVQTAHAQAALTPDAAIAHQPGIAAAANGTPIVNIVAPNGAGVSHNKFTDYNVGAAGLILNNSNSSVQTQLGGVIAGNDRLGASPAKVILNEVTGANASVLSGATEVAGPAARLIVANPNGITANGASFINATRASLVAGNPLFDADGNVTGFQTDNGRIEVQGKGIDARNIDEVDLVARSLLVNADIQAKRLNAVANKGRTQLQGGLLVATPDPETGGALPEVAIDVSALGGMHADSIRLVGKSAGVGVNVAGKIEALTGDIEINADGKLVVASNAEVAANKGLVINGALYNAGNLHANSISINGSARGESGSKIAAVENVQINGTANGGDIQGKRIQVNGSVNGSTVTAVEDVQINGGINGGNIQGNRVFWNGTQLSGPVSGSQIGNANGASVGSISGSSGINGGTVIGSQIGNVNGASVGSISGSSGINGGTVIGSQTGNGNVNGGSVGSISGSSGINGGTVIGSQTGNGNVNGGSVGSISGSSGINGGTVIGSQTGNGNVNGGSVGSISGSSGINGGTVIGSQTGNGNVNGGSVGSISGSSGINGGTVIGSQTGNGNVNGGSVGSISGSSGINGGTVIGSQIGNVNGASAGSISGSSGINGATVIGSQTGNGNVNGGQVEQQAGSTGNGAQPPIAELHPVAPTPGVTPPAQPEPIRVAGLTPDAKVELQPSIAAVVNGAPVVDIVAPNAAGLSHNKFVDYNVDKAGLILNNSSTAVETQLGGRIAGNAQLGNTPAKVILNEVTGSNESVLNGITEIAGSAARLIVANPSGITANGAGFVNATRATLVAGNPVFDRDGNIVALTTNNGRLVVERNGLDGSNVDRLDLVAGNIQVNGAVQAGKLTAVAHRGTASIDGDALSYTSDQWGYDYGRPVAIDVSSSGSVEADSARFVGASALTGVAVDGKISTGAGGLDVVSENSTFVGSRGSMSSDGALSVAGGLFNEGSVRGDTVSVRDGLRTFSNSVTEAGKSLSIDGGVMLGAGALRGDSVSVAGGANVGYGGTIAAKQDLSIKGGLFNQGKIQADTISVAGVATVGAGGSMKADHALSINGNAKVTRGGTLTAGQKLSIDGGLVTEGAVQARSVSVAGGAYVGGYRGASLQADGDLSIKGRANVGNGAIVASGQGLSIGGGLDNQGTVKAGSASIAGGANVGYGASLQTDNALSIDGATNVGYGGAVASGQKLAINGALDNRGSVKAGSVSVAGGATLGFGASLKADGALSIGGDTYAQSNSTLTAGQKMSVGGRFANEGTVQADTISVAQRVDNQAGASMKAVNGLSIGGDVSNQGILSSDAPVSIAGALFNGWTGVVSSGGKVSVKGGTTNFGRLTENANQQSVSAPGNAGNNSWGYVPMWGGYPFYQGGSPVMMVSSVRLW